MLCSRRAALPLPLLLLLLLALSTLPNSCCEASPSSNPHQNNGQSGSGNNQDADHQRPPVVTRNKGIISIGGPHLNPSSPRSSRPSTPPGRRRHGSRRNLDSQSNIADDVQIPGATSHSLTRASTLTPAQSQAFEELRANGAGLSRFASFDLNGNGNGMSPNFDSPRVKKSAFGMKNGETPSTSHQTDMPDVNGKGNSEASTTGTASGDNGSDEGDKSGGATPGTASGDNGIDEGDKSGGATPGTASGDNGIDKGATDTSEISEMSDQVKRFLDDSVLPQVVRLRKLDAEALFITGVSLGAVVAVFTRVLGNFSAANNTTNDSVNPPERFKFGSAFANLVLITTTVLLFDRRNFGFLHSFLPPLIQTAQSMFPEPVLKFVRIVLLFFVFASSMQIFHAVFVSTDSVEKRVLSFMSNFSRLGISYVCVVAPNDAIDGAELETPSDKPPEHPSEQSDSSKNAQAETQSANPQSDQNPGIPAENEQI